ncbi:MAG: hypothetical protein KA365_03755 [Arenimonas sp.]|nr:hypothetical protein [Arenimonas sp.]
MNPLLKSLAHMSKHDRFGVFLSNHHLLNIQPEKTQQALKSLFPERNCFEIMAMFQQGKHFMVREGRLGSLDTYAARLFSQGFQVDILPLD